MIRKMFAISVLISWILAIVFMFVNINIAVILFAYTAGSAIPFMYKWATE